MKITDIKVGDTLYYYQNKETDIRTYLRVLVWDPEEGVAFQINESSYCMTQDNQLRALEDILEAGAVKVTEEEYREAMDMFWLNHPHPETRLINYQEILDSVDELMDDSIHLDSDIEMIELDSHFKIELNRESKEVQVSFNGETEIIVNKPETTYPLICCQIMRTQLLFYKNDGREPSRELLEDIKCFDYILDAESIDERNLRAETYFEYKKIIREPRNIMYRLMKDKIWK